MNVYTAEEAKVRETAAAEFDATTKLPAGRALTSARHQAMNNAVEAWFKTLPYYTSITVRSEIDYDEIRDEHFGGSITVYGPRRECDWEKTREQQTDIYKIVPGYIGGSSWQAGQHGTSAEDTKQELAHRMKMMEIAIRQLNRRNQLCLDWKEAENPMEKLERVEKSLQEKENRLAEYKQKAEERKARRAR